jgi:hypothetical protein
MSADLLRKAAAKLRDTAAAATPGPWDRAADTDYASHYGANFIANWEGEYLRFVTTAGDGDGAARDAAWITLVHPGLAEPLAAWLSSIGETWVFQRQSARQQAVAIARVILGEVPDV